MLKSFGIRGPLISIVLNPFVVVVARSDVVSDVAEHREGVQWAAILLVRDVHDELTRTVIRPRYFQFVFCGFRKLRPCYIGQSLCPPMRGQMPASNQQDGRGFGSPACEPPKFGPNSKGLWLYKAKSAKPPVLITPGLAFLKATS